MNRRRILCILICFFICGYSSFALTIKIGSSAPAGSPWDDALQDMAAEWSRITDKRVQVQLYPGGSAGNEADVLRKVRIGQLQGAVVTSGGLTAISSDMLIFSLPLFIRSDDELDYILEVMEDDLRIIIEDKGFNLIAWQTAGWVRPFSKEPVIYPEDLKSLKLALPIDDADFVQAWKSIGFHIVQVSSNEFMTALQTNMIEAFIDPALVAASFQWFALAKYMCEINLTPLVGGLVIDKRVWSKIPEEYRPRLLQAAYDSIHPLHDATEGLTDRAIELMKDNGLVSFPVDAEIQLRWIQDLERSYDKIIGSSVDPELFRKMESHLERFRRGNN